ncbi:MAG: alpha/beta hydrolase, partial [Pseudomonadota bacterium]
KIVWLDMPYALPAGEGPHPAVIFNHGSTGSGRNPRIYRRRAALEGVARLLTANGFAVFFPQRRGRGKSGGTYGEGLAADGSGYSGDRRIALAGVDRALEDIGIACDHVAWRDDVDAARMVVAGVSRGGVLAIAYAGLGRSRLMGAINFNGGWLGRLHATHNGINTEVFRRGAAFARPSLWLYGSYDQYYRIRDCEAYFNAMVDAGGAGTFHRFPKGHNLVSYPKLWWPLVSRYLSQAIGG